MKVLFVGVGSIARRHIRNLRSIMADRGCSLTVDAYRRSASSSAVAGIDTTYTSYEEVPHDYDVVFITNPTEFHLKALDQFHGNGRHFFIEKPVVSINQIEQVSEFKTRSDTVYYVACPLRYSSVIRYVKEEIDPGEVLSVRSISSSYLPDWRPGQDYRMTYSAHRDLGGGVSIDLIHEWDYLTYLFGFPSNVHSFIGKKSDLEIDSDDYAIYIAEYGDKVLELHLDYFGRSVLRSIQLFTKKKLIVCDLINSKITYLPDGEEVTLGDERDTFQKREIECFLDVIQMRRENPSTIDHAIQVLQLSQGR